MQNKCLTILTLGCPNIRGWPGGWGLGGAASFFSPEIRAERPKNDRPLNQSYQPISVFETKMNH